MNEQTAGYISLGADLNKVGINPVPETKQGVVSQKLPELELDMKDEDIGKLVLKWEKEWTESSAKTRWDTMCEDNEKYWLGEHYDLPKVATDKQRPNVDNLIFESLETYLPQVTRRNPEPLVELAASVDKGDVNQKYVIKVKDKLADLADENVLRLKLKRAARHWGIYLIGVAKAGWDLDRDIPVIRIIRPKKIILDPDATVDEDGYTGTRIGEHRKMEASKLLSLMENDDTKKETIAFIKEKVGSDLGTELGFIEWWTAKYFCWTIEGKVIRKAKNPHWNYDRETPNTNVDMYGNETITAGEQKGINHLPVPAMPYEFLVVFNLGDQPMDRTSLIGQNLANQDRINKRNRQIDANADNMNNGLVVSLARAGLTESQGKRVSAALRKGGVVCIPDGNPQEAVFRPSTPSLPADVFNDLVDTRERMRDIFGTRGSTAAGIQSESTVRGKILARSFDTDRIGGGVSEYLEQFADRLYNWLYQLSLIYDDEFQFLGDARPPKLRISVKEGSLLPKDSTTIANQAIELATAGKMATIDMYKRLEYPNPEEMAANVWLEVNAPQILFQNDPRIAEALQMQSQAAAEAEEAKVTQAGQDHERGMERDVVREAARQRPAMPTGDPLQEVPLDVPVGVPSG